MEKAKYRVYINYKLCYTYVTTTRNTEDMIFQIREMHERDTINSFTLKITRQGPDGKEVVIYINRRDKYRKSWKSELYN